MAIELLRLEDVTKRTFMGRRAIYRQMSHPVHPFPKSTRLGAWAVWRADEVEAWIEARFNARKGVRP